MQDFPFQTMLERRSGWFGSISGGTDLLAPVPHQQLGIVGTAQCGPLGAASAGSAGCWGLPTICSGLSTHAVTVPRLGVSTAISQF